VVLSTPSPNAMSNTRAPARIDTWVWICIYVGMVVLGIGLAALRAAAPVAWALCTAGGALIAVGLVLVWLRSRLGASE
jgi:heme A synthase